MRLTSPALMATLKRINTDNLFSRAVVQHQSSIDQPGAGTSLIWEDRLPAPLDCRLSAPQANDQARLQAAKVEFTRAFWLIFADGADVLQTDRFVVTTELGAVIILYPVGGTDPRDAEVMRKVLCEIRS